MKEILKKLTDIILECEERLLLIKKEQSYLDDLKNKLEDQKREQTEVQNRITMEMERINNLNLVTHVLSEAEEIKKKNSEMRFEITAQLNERIKNLNLVTQVLAEAEDIKRKNSEMESNLIAQLEQIETKQRQLRRDTELAEADIRRRKREVEHEMKAFKKKVLREIGATKPLG
jgi:hypothetical protein